MKKIAIINYEVGNIKSIFNAFKYMGLKVDIIDNPLKVKDYDKIILPGVGSFKYCMEKIKEKKFDHELKNFVIKKKIILGICVGMQLLCKSSSEDGQTDGLNFFEDEVKKFSFQEVKNNTIPHIGFNSVITHKDSKLFNGFNSSADFYFIHSYRVEAKKKDYLYSYFNYGNKFVASIEKDNIYGVQFHPEKSQLNGIKLFYNFAKI